MSVIFVCLFQCITCFASGTLLTATFVNTLWQVRFPGKETPKTEGKINQNQKQKRSNSSALVCFAKLLRPVDLFQCWARGMLWLSKLEPVWSRLFLFSFFSLLLSCLLCFSFFWGWWLFKKIVLFCRKSDAPETYCVSLSVFILGLLFICLLWFDKKR